MRKILFLFSVFFSMCLVLSASAKLHEVGDRPAYASDRIIIKLTSEAKGRADLPQDLQTEKTTFGIASLDEKMARNSGSRLKRAHRRVNDIVWEQNTGFDRWFIIMLDGSTDVHTALSDFLTDPEVEDAGLEYFAYTQAVPNDSLYTTNWGHNNTGQGPGGGGSGWDSDAQLAWDQAQGYGSSSIIIAIIDTGVDTAHPDLRLVTGYDYGDNDPNPMDDSSKPGHGTACAGVAAAKANNGIGVAGIAGGCSVMPLKVANSNGDLGFTAITNAITHAADNGARVISLSLGAEGGTGEGDIPSTDYALEYAYSKGVVIFAATANSNASAIAYPSNHNKVISVGASSPTGQRKSPSSSDGEYWWGSNYGIDIPDHQGSVDIMAPTILPTTDITGSGNGYDINSDYYMWFNGTSCACPYAAGVAALILSLKPTLTPAQVWDIMKNSATDMTIDGGAGWDRYTGYGMVNAHRALLQPAAITWAPTSFNQELTPDATASQNLTIGNTGEIVLNYTLSKQVDSNPVLTEDFENGGSIPTGWTQEYDSYNLNWAFTSGGINNTNPASAHSGDYNARLYYNNSTTPRTTKLVTPSMDLSAHANPVLSFWHTQASWYGDQDQLKVYYKTSSGGPWTQIAHYTESITSWTQRTINLPNPSATYYVAFEGITDYGYGVCIDDVSIGSSSYTPSWLTLNGVDTVSGSVNGVTKDTDVIAVGFNSTGLAAGTYTTSLSLTSNSSSNPSISIPVTLQVEAPLPVQLSSFTAAISAENYVNLTWVTQTETGVQGFYVLRGGNDELAAATTVSELIQATNTSQQQTYFFSDDELCEDGTYWYWLQNSDLDGTVDYHGPISIAFTTVGGGIPSIPLVTALNPAYPNPFNPSTTLSYSLAEPSQVEIDIYNQRGQIVRSYSKEHNAPGHYSFSFDGRDHSGVPLSSGVYLYRMRAGTFSQFRKMVLCK
ncbi:MAG TPA: S8 family serine peptidase [Candidatus Syntrophosphaera sp.]|jgi:subtilisin family serine protease|nr:S8 family serine peptidase [Candidatus Syntrophosphaera sp.]HPW38613.1 S8 family serine peptidase [Candidatus Syntrophosphaera sp.]HQC47280.1 S8 family serine peptidase [Candidatus Syntrophosphaera sp.]